MKAIYSKEDTITLDRIKLLRDDANRRIYKEREKEKQRDLKNMEMNGLTALYGDSFVSNFNPYDDALILATSHMIPLGYEFTKSEHKILADEGYTD